MTPEEFSIQYEDIYETLGKSLKNKQFKTNEIDDVLKSLDAIRDTFLKKYDGAYKNIAKWLNMLVEAHLARTIDLNTITFKQIITGIEKSDDLWIESEKHRKASKADAIAKLREAAPLVRIDSESRER